MSRTVAKLARRFPAKRAFITGAAGGLGHAMARALAYEGWLLGIFDRDVERLSAAEHDLAALGTRVHAFPGDVGRVEEVTVAISSFVDAAGGLDILVNAAAAVTPGRFLDTPLEQWRVALDTNVLGTVNGCRAGLPYLQHNRVGLIVNVASAAAYWPNPALVATGAAHAAVAALSEALAREFASSNVQVTVALPDRSLVELSKAELDHLAMDILHAAAHGRDYLPSSGLRHLGWLKRYAPWLSRRLQPLFHTRAQH